MDRKEYFHSSGRWKARLQTFSLVFILVVVQLVKESNQGDVNCPVTTRTLYAYPDGDDYEFKYRFDPLIKTNIGIIDRLLTSDDEVKCVWEVRAKSGHFAAISFSDFQLMAKSGSKDPDCLKIYDGQTDDDDLLADLCGGSIPEDLYQSSGDRFLYLVYTQGEKTGRRSFRIQYKAVSRPKDFILKIAGIASGVVGALAITFLAFKFTRSCKPCRKRCCPDHSSDESSSNHRELHPLQAANGAPATSRSEGEGRMRSNGNQSLAARRQVSQPPPVSLPISQPSENEEDNESSPPPDEPPPSYHSIFGDDDVDGKNSALH